MFDSYIDKKSDKDFTFSLFIFFIRYLQFFI